MHGTDSSGREYIFMPRDRDKAINKLAGLSALAASREWERAAFISLLVESKGRGRPKSGKVAGFDRYSISEFTRLSIYGFRSHNTVAAYLRVWEMAGLPKPKPGDKITLPSQEFPDMNEIYGRDSQEDIGLEDEVVEEDESEEEAQPRPRPSSSSSTRPAPPAPSRSSPLESLLSAFNRVSPVEAAQGASIEQVRLAVKTMASWLADLDEILTQLVEEFTGPGARVR